MGILTRDEILEEIKVGNIEIDPFDKNQVGPASIDLYLGDEIRVFKKYNGVYKVTEESNYETITRLVKIQHSFIIRSGDVIHGITRERIHLCENLCAWLEGRSRFARLGLMVHVTAGLIQPGINNKQVLEITNMGPIPLEIFPGTRICQLVIQRTSGRAKYSGRFQNQTHP
ncbi:MAG: Deoxycytidine triphosphate deaminase [Elusimicrobia bacterium ADurb.Bin231]|nr:MAG: Deoxycytidine triphosphate deaminase [Elusimicrobia bacterium ADurb.Bin231]